jgi:murein DD-endopeptidase MepM/ murein hydrolase activator NlpD
MLGLALLVSTPVSAQLPAARLHADGRAETADLAAVARRTHRRAILRARVLAADDRPFPARLSPDGPVYRWPAPGVVSGDGEGAHIVTPPGAAALAPASGRVAYAGPFRTYGDVLILDHGHGWTTVLTGLATIAANQGATLAGGETIGTTGDALDVRLIHHGRTVDVVKLVSLLTR